jgi:hypothetical protein
VKNNFFLVLLREQRYCKSKYAVTKGFDTLDLVVSFVAGPAPTGMSG